MSAVRTEVCVIGGGPAGATAALRLAALGHEVCLLERSVFPRRRVGESLTPGIWPALSVLGLDGRVASAGFLPAVASTVLWSGELDQRVEPRGRAPGLLVDRGHFDALLLASAKERGVRVLQPMAARKVERGEGGYCITAAAEGGEARVRIEARFMVDASGRAGFLNGYKDGARDPKGARTLALHAYLRGDGLPDQTLVEAAEDGWYWGAKLPDGTMSVMVFVDPEAVVGIGRAGLEALFRARLGESRLFEACARAELVEGVRARDATPYVDTASIGLDFVKVGEAGFALDPLSSTGVEKAMQTALTGSVAAHTILARPHDADLAIAFWRERQREAVDRHAAWAAEHYRELTRFADRPFWRKRAMPAALLDAQGEPSAERGPARRPPGISDPAELLNCSIALSAEAELVDTPCITGDFIESRRALRHPGLERPVAFIGGVEIAPLLEEVQRGRTLLDIVRRWSPSLPMRQGLEVAAWLLARGVLGAA
jgi:flavin-dependent dehydrogenase